METWYVRLAPQHPCCCWDLLNVCCSQPENGQLIDLPTRAGDLVVLGTDGLYVGLVFESIDRGTGLRDDAAVRSVSLGGG